MDIEKIDIEKIEITNKIIYEIYMKEIIQYIHNAEKRAISKDYDVGGVQKKQWVVSEIRKNMPIFYNENTLLIETMIDSMILIGNNPSLILPQNEKKSFCCT